LTLRVLPRVVRPQISLAYLAARAADTVADTDLIPVERRLEVLHSLRTCIRNRGSHVPNLADFLATPGDSAERRLLTHLEGIFHQIDRFSQEDQQRIRQVLDMITSGQGLDLQRFGHAAGDQLPGLTDDEELDDYTYRVAGCVGEFWTKMCRAHVFPRAALDDAVLLAEGIRYGKGLQLINILRDLPQDLQRGRCYLPRKRLATAGLSPADLRDPANFSRFRPVYHHFMMLADEHLQAGWCYTNRIPWRFLRVRLACSWPILIGLRTLHELGHQNILVGGHPLKISRNEVRFLLLRSLISYPLPSAWRSLAKFSHRG
jgi:farnesyl-diphosphate farnesyltransferase